MLCEVCHETEALPGDDLCAPHREMIDMAVEQWGRKGAVKWLRRLALYRETNGNLPEGLPPLVYED